MRLKKPVVRLRAILFDLDGVLWFSVDAHRAAFEKAFHEMGLPLTFSKRAFSPYSGMTTEKALHHVLLDHKIRWTARRRAEFSRRKRAWALRYLQKAAKLQQRLYPTLKRLSRTHLLGLVSSGHPQTIRVFLKRSGAQHLFSVVLSHGDVPFSKPHPRIYKTALRRLHLRPDDAIAVEDTVSGTRSARGAGIPVIGMRGTCAPNLLRRAGAFKIVSRLTDLIPNVIPRGRKRGIYDGSPLTSAGDDEVGMRLIHDVKDIPAKRSPEMATGWTAIIPAAGRGSRLNFSGPKILYPILGKPILNWLMELVGPLCRDLVFICSPQGAMEVQPVLEPLGKRTRIVIQQDPTGMGDAIALAEGSVKTPCSLVLWGDQITPRSETLAACMTLLESSSSIQAVIPTMERDSPYIHFKRDAKDRMVGVFQARETDQRIARGESDCGLFCFRTEALFRLLHETRKDPAHQGAKTKENNFLSLIPLFDSQEGALLTVRLRDPDETVGINTVEDAESVGRLLKKRHS